MMETAEAETCQKHYTVFLSALEPNRYNGWLVLSAGICPSQICCCLLKSCFIWAKMKTLAFAQHNADNDARGS